MNLICPSHASEASARSIIKSSDYCNYLAHSSLRSQKRGTWFVFRAKPEKRTTSPHSRERSERVTK
ncbi:MAG: hypothetical protein U5L45_21350 [Saprospiraceae bacterium]|nr:hypothetical protein [Saprospiraceae bacterium]